MIIGILLGISLAINITSLIFIITSSTGILKENMATGAIIGVSQIPSYATTVLIISLITTLFLASILKGQPKQFQEY